MGTVVWEGPSSTSVTVEGNLACFDVTNQAKKAGNGG